MKVFNLVAKKSPFFKNQVKILKSLGVKTENIEVPNQVPRSINDYIAYYPKVLFSSLGKYDLIHANFGTTAPFAVFQPKRPIVLTLWGSDLKYILQSNKKAYFKRKLARIDSFNEIIVRNEEMKGKIKENFGKRAHVIPSGVNLEEFKPMDKIRCREKVGWPKYCKQILFPYNPSREVKNFRLAEGVFKKVKKSVNFEVQLKVVNNVPHEEMPFYMNAADLMLLTSKSEGSPNTVKEAMACNTPVVSTDVGDVKYLLKGVKGSMVVNCKEKLIIGVMNIINNDKKFDNSRKRVKELGLGLNEMGHDIISVYEKALEKYE